MAEKSRARLLMEAKAIAIARQRAAQQQAPAAPAAASREDSGQLPPPTPMAAPAPTAGAPRHGDWDEFKLGMAGSGIKTGLGVKSLFTDLSDENKQVLEMVKEDAAKAGPWGQAGNITGEVMQLAVPAAKISHGAKLLKSPAAQKAALIGGEMGLAGTYGATRAGADEDKTRLEGAKDEMLSAALGMGAGKVLSKAAEGVKKSKAGEYLTERGVKLTPGQAAEGGLPKALEYTMGILPGAAKGTQIIQDEALESFSKAALQEAAPKGFKVTVGGNSGVDELAGAFDTAYKSAWKEAKIPKDADLLKMMEANAALKEVLGDADPAAGKIEKALDRVINTKSKKSLSRLDKKLRDEILKASKGDTRLDVELAEGLSGIRKMLGKSVGSDTTKALREVNDQFGKYAATRNAAETVGALKRGPDLEGGFFNADELMSGVKRAGRGRAARGKAPLQEFAKAGVETIGDKGPQPLTNWMKGVSGRVMSPTPVLRKLADATLGRTATQAKARELAKQLRKMGVTPSTLGVAISDEE